MVDGIDEFATVDVNCNDKSCQVFTNVIPQVGSYFSVCSSRDEHGDYRMRKDVVMLPDVQEVLNGIVVAIKYLYEETGTCPANNRKTMFVNIKLRPLTWQEEKLYKEDW